VPILNLLAPVLAAATMVHVFEGLPRRHTKPDRSDPHSGTTVGKSSTGGARSRAAEETIHLPGGPSS